MPPLAAIALLHMPETYPEGDMHGISIYIQFPWASLGAGVAWGSSGSPHCSYLLHEKRLSQEC